MKQNEKNKWNGADNVPATACRFVSDNAIGFADDSGEDKKIKLVGYRGEIIDHWFWGRLGIDMDGLHFAKKKTPGLIDHNTSKRLTFSQEQQTKPETYIAGPFLDNANAQEIAMDIDRGFPFQASLSVEPEIVEQVTEGQSVSVNGKTLKGPGAAFRKASILEISAVVFGAFSNTESTAYSDNQNNIKFELIKSKEIQMAKQKNDERVMTIEQFKADHEQLHQQVFEAGAKSQTERFDRLRKVCGDDHALLVKCFTENMDTAEAQSAKIEKLSAQNQQLSQKLQEKQDDHPQKKPDPAVTEFNNQPAVENQPDAKFDEKTATEEQLTEHFNSNQDLQDEFGDNVADYLSFVKNDRKGNIKVLSR